MSRVRVLLVLVLLGAWFLRWTATRQAIVAGPARTGAVAAAARVGVGEYRVGRVRIRAGQRVHGRLKPGHRRVGLVGLVLGALLVLAHIVFH